MAGHEREHLGRPHGADVVVLDGDDRMAAHLARRTMDHVAPEEVAGVCVKDARHRGVGGSEEDDGNGKT
jgi:hypothetical protein